MKTNNTIKQILNKLNTKAIQEHRFTSKKDIYKVTLILPESMYNKPINIQTNSLESSVQYIQDIYIELYDIVTEKVHTAIERWKSTHNKEDQQRIFATQKESRMILDTYQLGYFTIDGDNRKFSTEQISFDYCFAKGRISLGEMLNWAEDLMNGNKEQI